MFSRFRKTADAHVKPTIPDGQRIYCVGDIHGRADLLRQTHDLILSDAADYDGRKTAVYLGDYVDRGEHSHDVIEILLSRALRSNASRSGMGFISCAPLCSSARPLSTFKNGTTRLTCHR